ncbi:MAG TPA: hypothetical protein VNY79_08700 [Xanthobacteraceae bacterium]|nr:hypothetical protein [Xanthobacteraceae bacterium]
MANIATAAAIAIGLPMWIRAVVGPPAPLADLDSATATFCSTLPTEALRAADSRHDAPTPPAPSGDRSP